jgi:hypothetical protein
VATEYHVPQSGQADFSEKSPNSPKYFLKKSQTNMKKARFLLCESRGIANLAEKANCFGKLGNFIAKVLLTLLQLRWKIEIIEILILWKKFPASSEVFRISCLI